MQQMKTIAFLFMSITVGCNRGPIQQPPHQEQPPRTGQTQPTPAPQEEPSKYVLLDNDPEYKRLREMSALDLVHQSSSYQKAVADRQSRLEAQVGQITDPALHAQMLKEAEASVPAIDANEYYSEAQQELEQQQAAYLSTHKDSYFVVATYEQYRPKTNIAIFNLRKPGALETAERFAKDNFGAPANHDANLISCDPIYGPSLDDPFVIAEDRYQKDFLDFRDTENGLLLRVPLAQMDAMFAAVRKRFSSKMDEVYQSELKVGGDHPSYARGQFVPYDSEIKRNVLRKDIEHYFRRQSIWILGRGNPMDRERLKVTEAFLVVVNDEFGKITRQSQPMTLAPQPPASGTRCGVW